MNCRTVVGIAAVALLATSGAYAEDHPVQDSVITTKVKAELAKDSSTSASKIHVTTKDGVVMLSGKAATKEEAAKAEQDAKLIDGVKEVRNKIDVK
jgi:osmotically-inducible protein OsmY